MGLFSGAHLEELELGESASSMSLSQIELAISRFNMLSERAAGLKRVDGYYPQGALEAQEATLLDALCEVFGDHSSQHEQCRWYLDQARSKRSGTYIQVDGAVQSGVQWLNEAIPVFIKDLEHRRVLLLKNGMVDLERKAACLAELSRLMPVLVNLQSADAIDGHLAQINLGTWDCAAIGIFEKYGLSGAREQLDEVLAVLKRDYSTGAYGAGASHRMEFLNGWLSAIEQQGSLFFPKGANGLASGPASALDLVKQVCGRFDVVARSLLTRYGRRTPLQIADEYDVQDLLKSMLRIHFETVVSEDTVSKVLDAATRIDLLLPTVKIGIEVKFAGPDLKLKEIGKQLADDILKYKTHKDCRTLICFVYDPQLVISTPRHAEDELRNSSTDAMAVEAVIVQPGHPHVSSSY